MSSQKVITLFCCFCLSALTVFSQGEEDKQEAVQSVIELIAETNENEDIDYINLLDALHGMLDRPADLNRFNFEELKETYLISDIQLISLQDHIARNGKLLSIYELQAVEGFDMQTIRAILPFVAVNRDIDALSIKPKEIWQNGKHEVFLRWFRILEDQAGYQPLTDTDYTVEDGVLVRANENNRYLGSPDRLYMRYRFKYSNRISVGFTAEKDPGEEFFKGSQKQGFDFYSAHVFLKNFGKLKRLSVGDFHAQFGQGLTLWTGLAYGKSINILSIKRNGTGLRQYTSVDENLFLRGAGATVAMGDFDFTLLASHKKRDANIVLDSLENELVVSSLQASGLHARPSELDDKDAITETVLGGNVKYQKGANSIGVSAVHSRLEGLLQRNLQLYQQFEFNENENTVIGVDYNATVRNVNFFGEVARSSNGGVAYLNGALIALDPKLTVSIFHRNYDTQFQNLWANANAEATRPANERGLLTGLIFKPAKHWTLSGYYDRFRSDWLKFQADGPSVGQEGIVQAEWKPSKKFSMYARYRKRDRPKNSTLDLVIDQVGRAVQNNYRVNVSYKVSENITMRNRVEWTDFSREGNEISHGFLLYHDILYRPKSSPLSLTFRYALFDTDNYDSRIYTYEHNVLYAYSIPAFSGRGSRYYLVGKYKAHRNLDIWVKYARVTFTDAESIASFSIGDGLNLINDNKRTELWLQLRYKF